MKRREIDKARKLLQEYARSKEFQNKIARQFYHAMEIQLMLYEQAPDEELAKHLEQAVKLTVPKVDEKKICDLQLSPQEMNLVLEYEKYCRPERFTERCEELMVYIEDFPMEERSRAQIYPKVVWYLCEALGKGGDMDFSKIIKNANKAIECLRNTEKNHYLWELLSLKETVLEKRMEQLRNAGNEKKAEALQNMYQENMEWKNAFAVVYEVAKFYPYTEDYCYLYMQQEVYCINEVVRIRRNMMGLSRNKLNAGTFDKKTLIRMETENRKTRMDVVKTLFARLNLSGVLQREDVVAGCKEARELLEQIVKYSNNFEIEKEQRALEELEKYLDMSIPLNQQFVKKERAIILYGEDRNNREKAFKLMKDALECTIAFEIAQKSDKLYLTGEEIGCIFLMADYCGELSMNIYSEVLEKVCCMYEKEDAVEEHISRYTWLMTALAQDYSNGEQHTLAIEMAEKVMRSGFECGKLAYAERNLNCVSWNDTQLRKKGISRVEMRDRKSDLNVCAVLSGFFKNKYREKYYEEKLIELERN